jgi:hypothetical protein
MKHSERDSIEPAPHENDTVSQTTPAHERPHDVHLFTYPNRDGNYFPHSDLNRMILEHPATSMGVADF